MILLHPASATSPQAVARVERATGLRAVVAAGGRAELRAPPAHPKVVVDTSTWTGAMDGLFGLPPARRPGGAA